MRVMDEVHGSSGTWPAILDVVASKGWRGVWRAREGARASGFERNRGSARWIWPGARRGHDAWPTPAAIADTARNREGGEREMEVMADL